MGSLDVFCLRQSFSAWFPAKDKRPQSNGDTSEVSTNGTLMLKSESDTNEQAEKHSFGKEISSYLSE